MNEKMQIILKLDAELLEKYKQYRNEVSPKFPVEETFEYWIEEDIRQALFEAYSARMQGGKRNG